MSGCQLSLMYDRFSILCQKKDNSEWRRGLTCNFSCFNLNTLFLEILSESSEFIKHIIFLSIFLSKRTIFFVKFPCVDLQTQHHHFSKRIFKERNALKYCLPGLLGIHKNPKQKYFLKSCECLIYVSQKSLKGFQKLHLFWIFMNYLESL